MAPFIFALVMDWVLRTAIPDDSRGFLLERRTSSRHNEKRISLLAYADDLVLLASEDSKAQEMLDNLTKAALRVGLQINVKKTEVLSIPTGVPPQVSCMAFDGSRSQLKTSTSFKYLGGQLPNTQEDFTRRRALAWAALNKMRPIWTASNLTDKLRSSLFTAIINSILTYNAETWTFTDIDFLASR